MGASAATGRGRPSRKEGDAESQKSISKPKKKPARDRTEKILKKVFAEMKRTASLRAPQPRAHFGDPCSTDGSDHLHYRLRPGYRRSFMLRRMGELSPEAATIASNKSGLVSFLYAHHQPTRETRPVSSG
jgi:hypothetical protein